MGACEGKAQDLSSELVVESDNGPGRLDMLYPEFMAQTSPFLPIQELGIDSVCVILHPATILVFLVLCTS